MADSNFMPFTRAHGRVQVPFGDHDDPSETLEVDQHGIKRRFRHVMDPSVRQITWREQLNHPLYRFVRLVAGYTNEPMRAFVEDDTVAVEHLRAIQTIRSWEAQLDHLRQRARALAHVSSPGWPRVIQGRGGGRVPREMRHRRDGTTMWLVPDVVAEIDGDDVPAVRSWVDDQSEKINAIWNKMVANNTPDAFVDDDVLLVERVDQEYTRWKVATNGWRIGGPPVDGPPDDANVAETPETNTGWKWWIRHNPYLRLIVCHAGVDAAVVGGFVDHLHGRSEAIKRDIVKVRGILQTLKEKARLDDRGDDFQREVPTQIGGHFGTNGTSTSIYVTNELLLRPVFHAALNMTYTKLQGHLGSTLKPPTVEELMGMKPGSIPRDLRQTTRTLFAYLVSRNILITRVNNPRTVYKKVIDYRRLVAQENAAMTRLGRICRGTNRRSDTLFGFDSRTEATRLF